MRGLVLDLCRSHDCGHVLSGRGVTPAFSYRGVAGQHDGRALGDTFQPVEV